jgi:hypothetical protein
VTNPKKVAFREIPEAAPLADEAEGTEGTYQKQEIEKEHEVMGGNG